MILAVECGITIEKFWRISWREFVLYRKGYEQRELREWERSRFIGWMVYNNIVKYEKGAKKNIKKFLPLSSDQDEAEEITPLTSEQFIDGQKRLAEAFKKIKPNGAGNVKNNTNRRQQTGFGVPSRNSHKPKRGGNGIGKGGNGSSENG